MQFDQAWENIHLQRNWGAYPKEELVRWVCGKLRPGQQVLDLGSGQGASSWFLAREGFTPVAADGSFNALDKARLKLDRDGYPLMGAVCDLNRLPFVADCFDAVVDVVSSAHNTFADICCIFKEVRRVLKPGGKLFSVLPSNRCNRRTFTGLTTTFLFKDEIYAILRPHLVNTTILRSSYQLDPETTIDTWVVTAEKQGV